MSPYLLKLLVQAKTAELQRSARHNTRSGESK